MRETPLIFISKKELHYFKTGVARRTLHEVQLLSGLGNKVYILSEKVNNTVVNNHGAEVLKTFRFPISGFLRRVFYNYQTRRYVRWFKPNLVIGHGEIVEQDILFIHNCVHLAHEKIKSKSLPSRNPVGRIHHRILTEQKFNYLICNSEFARKDLVERFNIPESKVVTIYPEIDLNHFKVNKHQERKSFLENLGIDVNTFLIGTITSGNFPKRNIDLIVEIAKELKAVNGIHFIIVGNNKHSKIKKAAAEFDINLHFIAPEEDVFKFYDAIDLFFLPARIEEFGRSVSEAMATGNPVLLSRWVGASEILEGKQREYIFDSDAKENYRRAILKLSSDPRLCEELAKLNLETVKKISAKVQDRKFLAIVDKCLNNTSIER